MFATTRKSLLPPALARATGPSLLTAEEMFLEYKVVQDQFPCLKIILKKIELEWLPAFGIQASRERQPDRQSYWQFVRLESDAACLRPLGTRFYLDQGASTDGLRKDQMTGFAAPASPRTSTSFAALREMTVHCRSQSVSEYLSTRPILFEKEENVSRDDRGVPNTLLEQPQTAEARAHMEPTDLQADLAHPRSLRFPTIFWNSRAATGSVSLLVGIMSSGILLSKALSATIRLNNDPLQVQCLVSLLADSSPRRNIRPSLSSPQFISPFAVSQMTDLKLEFAENGLACLVRRKSTRHSSFQRWGDSNLITAESRVSFSITLNEFNVRERTRDSRLITKVIYRQSLRGSEELGGMFFTDTEDNVTLRVIRPTITWAPPAPRQARIILNQPGATQRRHQPTNADTEANPSTKAQRGQDGSS